jgi:hypothetical protein
MPNKVAYQFRIEFTTGDGLYHLGAYYQINLSFSPEEIDLTWETVFDGVGSNPWTITDSGRSLRYTVENSENCGGTNANTQTGMATTTIEIPNEFTIKTLNGKILIKNGLPSCECCVSKFGLLARGTSQALNLGCEMGPIISEFIVQPPYKLSNTVSLDLTFDGVGEFEDTGFENISFYLDPADSNP